MHSVDPLTGICHVLHAHASTNTLPALLLCNRFASPHDLPGGDILHVAAVSAWSIPQLQGISLDVFDLLGRDLKPENVLLTTNGDVKLSDFGLGYLPSSSLHNDVLQTTCGTPNYVAPEVLMREGYYGAPADVWSLGQLAMI